MAFRDVAPDELALVQWMREMQERLERVEQGGAHAGRVSFGDTILIGDLEIRARVGGGHADDTMIVLTARNIVTGTEVRLATLA